MSQPQMDRPRERSGTPMTREAMRLLKAGAVIVAVVLIVGSLPILGVWFFADELQPGAATATFGYSDEEFRFTSADGVSLAARLRLPVGPGPHPLLIAAHGSGRATRDHYEQISNALALNGYAFLSYDKRGVGDSEGVYSGVGPGNSEVMFGLLSADIVAGAEHAAARDDIDGERIGVYGVSQGGWIGPVALARSDLLRYLVVISGTTVSVGSEIYYSQLTGETEGAGARGDAADLSAQMAAFAGPHGFDPLPVLEALDRPILWILGSGDRSIPIPETVARLEALVAAGASIEVVVIPGVGHGMRNARSGVRQDNFPRIFGWLQEHSGN